MSSQAEGAQEAKPRKSSKKGKGKGKGKTKGPKPFLPVRTYYQKVIADLNEKLAKLRRLKFKIDGTNISLKEDVQKMHEDRLQLTEYMKRNIGQTAIKIKNLEERISEQSKARDEDNQAAVDRINELEVQFKDTKSRLERDIKMLTGKLHTLGMISSKREELLHYFNELADELINLSATKDNDLFRKEQKMVVEKDAIKKAIESKLNALVKDFQQCSEVRNSEYEKRLIRENINLQKEFDDLMQSQIKLRAKLKETEEAGRDVRDEYFHLKWLQEQLIANSENKFQVIKGFIPIYEHLAAKYLQATKYRRLVEETKVRKLCEVDLYKSLQKRVSEQIVKIKKFKVERKMLVEQKRRDEKDIAFLRKSIRSVRSIVVGAYKEMVGPLKDDEKLSVTESEDFEECDSDIRRGDLMGLLISLICLNMPQRRDVPNKKLHQQDEKLVIPKSQMFVPGTLGFYPLMRNAAKPITDVFKRELSADIEVDSSTENSSSSKVSSLLLELGSTLYVTSLEDQEVESSECSSSSFTRKLRTTEQSNINDVDEKIVVSATATAKPTQRSIAGADHSETTISSLSGKYVTRETLKNVAATSSRSQSSLVKATWTATTPMPLQITSTSIIDVEEEYEEDKSVNNLY